MKSVSEVWSAVLRFAKGVIRVIGNIIEFFIFNPSPILFVIVVGSMVWGIALLVAGLEDSRERYASRDAECVERMAPDSVRAIGFGDLSEVDRRERYGRTVSVTYISTNPPEGLPSPVQVEVDGCDIDIDLSAFRRVE
jgi:hypothetical protein